MVGAHTLFPDQAVVSVVGVVGVSCDGTPTIAYYSEIEFCCAFKDHWLAGASRINRKKRER